MPQPPRADARPTRRLHHGDEFVDDFAWMSDKGSADFLAHLAAENAYTVDATAHLAPLRDELYDDILARTPQTDLSVPSFVRPTDGSACWYYPRTIAGLAYPAPGLIFGPGLALLAATWLGRRDVAALAARQAVR